MTETPTAYAFIERPDHRMEDIERSAIYARIEQLHGEIQYLGWAALINFVLIIGVLIVLVWAK